MTSQSSPRLSARDYSPIPWTEYFDEAHDIQLDDDEKQPSTNQTKQDNTEQHQDSFRVYLKNFRHPYAPQRPLGSKLDSSTLELSTAEWDEYSKIPTVVALHGGGYSGLTWAQFTKHIEQQCRCRVLAMDLRAHGATKTSNDDQTDIVTLVSDVIKVIHATHQICGFNETPKIVLIGHSMGGAIAVNCATKCTSLLPSLAGFVVIDVVEGTAKTALPQMMSVIQTRPTRFPSISNAIEWSVRSGMAKNLSAARVSMPGNLINISNGKLSIYDVTSGDESRNTDSCEFKKPAETDTTGYSWRTDLAKTQPYWNGWFDGLSEQLLNAPVQGKFLLLAGIDRLDKTLTIGHMQGKFMMKVLPKCGHAVHEDVPEQVALAIGDFLVRNKFTTRHETEN